MRQFADDPSEAVIAAAFAALLREGDADRTEREHRGRARPPALEADEELPEEPPEAPWVPPPLEPGPCPGCTWSRQCAQLHLACEQFSSFVARGARARPMVRRYPTRKIFDRIYQPDAGVVA